MKKFLFTLIVLTMNCFGQSKIQPEIIDHPVKWYSVEEAVALNKKSPRPLLIDVYTDWCGWCKHMMKTTFMDPNIAQYINNNYYAVRFDAESRDTIEFEGKKYFNPYPVSNTRGIHSLTNYLVGNRASFPTIVYLDKELKVKNPVPGYMDSKAIEPLLVYFAEELNKSTAFDSYQKYFNYTFHPDSTYNELPKGEVNWLSIEEALKKQNTSPKKMLIHYDANWVVSSKMMATTFKDSLVAEIINKSFYAVNFDVLSRDTLNVFGGKFFNPNPHPSIHQLAAAMLDGKIKFPSIMVLDEEGKMLDRIQFYNTPQTLVPILKYFGEDIFKQKSWKEFSENQ